jgi:hypothetical protein
MYAPFQRTARIGKTSSSRYSCIARISMQNWVCACMCTYLPENYNIFDVRVTKVKAWSGQCDIEIVNSLKLCIYCNIFSI